MNKLQLLEEHFINNKDTMVKQATRKVGEFWADDVVSEAYTRCLKYVGAIPPDAKSLNSYVYKVMRNVLKDYMSDRINAVEVEEDMLESGEMVDEWEAKGVLEEIKADIFRLASPRREIIYCALIQGDGYGLISSINKVNVQTVKDMVKYYRRQLEEKYV